MNYADYRPFPQEEEHTMLSPSSTSGVPLSTRTKTRSIPIKKSSSQEGISDDDERIASQKDLYDMSTWRMYHRIMKTRKHQHQAVTTKGYLSPVHFHREPYGNKFGSTRMFLIQQHTHSRACFDLHHHHGSHPSEDDLQYGEIFELEL